MNSALEELKKYYRENFCDVATSIIQLNEALDGKRHLSEGEQNIIDMENKDRNKLIRDFAQWAIEQEKMEEEEQCRE
ncbi:hypothetical protein AWK91_15055 [Listeria monocytogenes]|uniref:hypothetical protein n=1 Tax=Listeria monocytogenes TaxID=1639 RepID=UPI000BE0AC4C|nr:hypothetical protein [Listeria monocytogenes]EAE2723146.1 hypothetical protein [Listeria monocytogenes]EAE2738829.1 hypothetical protein [Listeria monocytogenes]EAE5300124.1 hypothetical protein [Listeria monocytogenes]PDD83146.1 hypothetical protein AWK40_14535 [Listeria monocytogenes]PDD94463.1 hypothetical protein AWK44_03065 [Listeria monocytogenes]